MNESLERQLWPNLDAMSERNRKLVSEQRAFNSTMQLSFPSLETLGGSDRLKDAKLGVHPDFRDLKNSDKVEYHYIVSVFIDILGSTNLHKEYDWKIFMSLQIRFKARQYTLVLPLAGMSNGYKVMESLLILVEKALMK